jgi:hypothetical protein
MAALGFVMVGTGLVLVWAGIRGENAVTIVEDVFSGSRKLAKASPAEQRAKAAGTQVIDNVKAATT